MNKTQHTPGPWKQIIAQPGTMLEIVNDEREYVCSLLGGDEHKQENARLIEKAPDLLTTLELLTEHCTYMNNMQHMGQAMMPYDWSVLSKLQNQARALIVEVRGA